MSHFWRMTAGKIKEGVFAINKPTGLSSAQVIRDLQHHFNPSELFAPWIESENKARDRESHNQKRKRKQKKIQVKIGHGGTLDPLATGVLITGVGKGTKSLQDFLLCTKVYEAVVLFGTSTDTYDRVGKVLKRTPYDHITKEKVADALGQFRGKFMQLPPLYSALKMNGKPLYAYAREGKEIPKEIERRAVDVLELEMVEWMEGGTHNHKPPTDEAGHEEVNVASKLWKQENAQPTGKTAKTEAKAKDEFKKEEKLVKIEEDEVKAMKVEEIEGVGANGTSTKSEQPKRKMDDEIDDLVRERPASKKGKQEVSSSEDVVMSGGLDAPESIPIKSEEGLESKPIKSEETPYEASPVKGPPAVRLRMTVTSGFYVRSLCHDLGVALGSSALMAELERTRQGEFELGKNVLDYDDLEKGEKVWGPKVDGMLEEWYQNHKPKPQESETQEPKLQESKPQEQ